MSQEIPYSPQMLYKRSQVSHEVGKVIQHIDFTQVTS